MSERTDEARTSDVGLGFWSGALITAAATAVRIDGELTMVSFGLGSIAAATLYMRSREPDPVAARTLAYTLRMSFVFVLLSVLSAAGYRAAL